MARVYRGLLSSLDYGGATACANMLDGDLTDTSFEDTSGDPVPSTRYYYLVTSEDALGNETGLGLGRCGERSNPSSCP